MEMRRTCLIFLTILYLCSNAAGQSDVGWIINLKGTAQLKKVNGKKIKILTEKNFARPLQPNQELKVDKGGQMQIKLCNKATPFSISHTKWYKVPTAINCPSSADLTRYLIMEKHFGFGPESRTGDGFILFPIESENIIDTIRPETVVLRWVPTEKEKLDLSIRVMGIEDKVWEKHDVSGKEGSFTNDELKSFLKDIREKHPNARLQLKIQTMSNKGPATNTSTFQLFSTEKDRALQQELVNLKEENKLLFHLFRARIYYSYNLFIEAAAEYEEALNLSPESLDLLKDMANIEERAGNVKRSAELKNYIEILDKRMK
jgi:tetratricopeptide (TPR) repeat protein